MRLKSERTLLLQSYVGDEERARRVVLVLRSRSHPGTRSKSKNNTAVLLNLGAAEVPLASLDVLAS